MDDLVLNSLGGMADGDLILAYAATVGELDAARALKNRIEREMEDRMRERQATAIPNALYDIRLERPRTLDPELLMPLATLLPAAVWRQGFTAAHEETIQFPAKADGRIVFGWLKYGGQIAQIVEGATVLEPARLKITARKVKGEVA